MNYSGILNTEKISRIYHQKICSAVLDVPAAPVVMLLVQPGTQQSSCPVFRHTVIRHIPFGHTVLRHIPFKAYRLEA